MSSRWGNKASSSPDATSKGAGGQAEQVAVRCSLVRLIDSNGAGSASGISQQKTPVHCVCALWGHKTRALTQQDGIRGAAGDS